VVEVPTVALAAQPVKADGRERWRVAPPPADAYARFIDNVIATAASAEFASSPGPGDARLRGLRQ
jgi:hypothetical protein